MCFIVRYLLRSSQVIDVPVVEVESNADLEGYGCLIDSLDDMTTENKKFEIVKWPVSGWRQLDPSTGDEAGTTEGPFEVEWKGDFFRGKNLAINTPANEYLDGLGTSDFANATDAGDGVGGSEDAIYLWMTDYHPCGGQLFMPQTCSVGEVSSMPFFMCLAKASVGDDVNPSDMVGFKIPPGKGAYIHPNVWHNGFYVNRRYGRVKAITRQSRVHARVSASWANERGVLLKMPLK